MRKCDVRTPEQALAYITDCNLATVAHMSSVKNKSKCEFKRQIEIAQTACDWMRDMRVSPTNTRAAEIIGKTTVEEWSKTFTY